MSAGFTKILCPVDFSESSRYALGYAVSLARLYRAHLELYHVLELPVYSVPGDSAMTSVSLEFLKDVENACAKRLGEMVDEIRRELPDAVSSLESGEPFHAILRKSQKEKFDLIVMGTHGRTGLSHMLIGSVAEKVVRKSACPVLTIKHPEHEFVMP